MSYFITGTDTGVGKTLISCALLHGFAAQGKRAVGMKPIAAGCIDNDMHEDVKQLCAASNVQVDQSLINPYGFTPAIAPHIAAQQAGVSINVEHIVKSFHTLQSLAEMVIVEGAGGFCVPLNAEQDSAELAKQLGMPVILVVGMRLGCLNHALLTCAAIAARGVTLAGWVANGITENMSYQAENIAALQQRIAAPLLGIVPFQSPPDVAEIAAQLDLKWLVLK